MIATWLLLSCATEPTSVSVDTASPMELQALTELEAPRLLRRLSLDLRGVLPTPGELDQVAADPAALETLRDAHDTPIAVGTHHLPASRFAGRADASASAGSLSALPTCIAGLCRSSPIA